MRLPFHLLAAAGIFASAVLSAPAAFVLSSPQATQVADTVVVPAETEERMFVVPVTINGLGPFRMLVDTGASLTVLTPRLAAAVGATELRDGADAMRAFNAFNAPTDVKRTQLDSIAIGAARFQGVPAVVTEELDAMSRISGRAVDGIIGFSVFADVVVALDFPGRQLVIGPHWPDQLPAVRHRLDLSVVNDVPVITARLPEVSFELVIDTGANDGLTLPEGWGDALPWQNAPRPGRLVKVLGDLGRETIGRLGASVFLGDVELARPVVALHPGNPSLGLSILQRFCVVFDARQDAMWLCGAEDVPVTAPPVRTLGLSLTPEADSWRVAGIVPGSPAEAAGISVGDQVTSIEGRPATGWSRSDLDRWVEAHASTLLEVARGTAVRALRLDSWSLVP